MTWPQNWALGAAPRRCPVLRSCMRSPAWRAPCYCCQFLIFSLVVIREDVPPRTTDTSVSKYIPERGPRRDTYHRASNQIDQHARLVRLRDDEGKEQLCQLADARHGVEVCLAQGAHAHDAQHERHEDGRDGRVQRHEVAKDDVDAGDAEDDGEDEAHAHGAVADLLLGGCVVLCLFLVVFVVVVLGPDGSILLTGSMSKRRLHHRRPCVLHRGKVPHTRPQRQMPQTDNRIRQHDRQRDPDYPPLASMLPVIDTPRRPALVLGQRRQHAPSHGRSNQHVQRSRRAHDNSLSDVRQTGIQRPQPRRCRHGPKDGEIPQHGEEVSRKRKHARDEEAQQQQLHVSPPRVGVSTVFPSSRRRWLIRIRRDQTREPAVIDPLGPGLARLAVQHTDQNRRAESAGELEPLADEDLSSSVDAISIPQNKISR